MLPRLGKVSQGKATDRALRPLTKSEASDGDLPNGAGFREPAPDPEWRARAEEQNTPETKTPAEAPLLELSSEHWSELQSHLRQQQITSRPAGLTRYRETPGSRRSVKRFRKGVVLDEAG